MILDAATLDRSQLPESFDVCVIGAGPAGITLARRLANAGATVALMEAGGFDITEESQDVYRGENVGRDYFELETARLRYFGGTSNHWGGWSRALDLYDFEPRPFHPMSGWPIAQLDLDPYRAEADRILDLPSATEAPDLPMKENEYIFRRFQFRFSAPTRFGEKYRDEIAASDRITLVLNANLVDLQLDGVLSRVTGAVFRNYDPADTGFTVAARAYALCCGGIENARLLLNFDSQMHEGLGNRTGMVGRCFCDHPHYVVGDVVLQTLLLEREFYSPFETFMLDAKCLNFGMRLEPGWIEPSDLPSLVGEQITDEEFAIHLRQRVRDSAVDLTATERTLLGSPSPQTASMRMAQEQQQNPESRVMLGDERDAFGLRRVRLDWRLTDLDIHTMRTAAKSFAAHLAEQQIGRARIRPWLLQDPPEFPLFPDEEVGGKHHMCTTRMSDDPKTGVVDADCKVHDLANLFIGGSSVFATTGHANPTYTITQLALRLGDHLTGWLKA
ncbi:choline dehydrogenase-like flavoprotein [Amaricoccus macauensis]|uniref:Choline dehydrogenase-like flavoprotein n=1 Tax=Amaricoccus macauensis TaxID=57001 RepID=A0A840SS65_9RHOB|nr:GMC family oxidoreductase [Amaricoccus macauensis]MBB5222183.1 choline dehydrogenase-like flavoprotein [Amaricoccus macauensis]